MLGIRRFKGNFCKGNRVDLFVNGEEFFPQLQKRIEQAEHEIFIETFILANDKVGELLKEALIDAAKRGVWVSITADSWGSFYLDEEYILDLTEAGIVFQIYDPQPSWYRGRPKLFRRLHRKLAVIDGRYGFIGGINLCHDHMMNFGPGGKQDYAVEVQGPVVKDMRQLCKSYVRDADDQHLAEALDNLNSPPVRGPSEIAFVSRDNRRHRSDIEKAYIDAIHAAKNRVWIANAYFFPGYRLLKALRKAAGRGVDVWIIVQGDPDIPFSLMVARTVYEKMIRSRIKVFEFCDRPLHAKIAIIDNEWSTIGSSNLDPLSLAFNLEANIIVKCQEFNTQLSEKITYLKQRSNSIESNWLKRRRWWLVIKDFLMYHALRHYPAVGGLFPAHLPKIRELKARVETASGDSADENLREEFAKSNSARKVLAAEDYAEVNEVEKTR